MHRTVGQWQTHGGGAALSFAHYPLPWPADCDCAQCAGDLWLSAVVSPAAPGVAVCPEHAEVGPAGAGPDGHAGQTLASAHASAGSVWQHPTLCLHSLGAPPSGRRLPPALPGFPYPPTPRDCPRRAGAGAPARLPAGQPGAAVPPHPAGAGRHGGAGSAARPGGGRGGGGGAAAARAHRGGARAGATHRCVPPCGAPQPPTARSVR